MMTIPPGASGSLSKPMMRKTIQTDFNEYVITDATYAGRPARLLYSGHLEAAQSGIARDDKPELLFDYNERFMELLRHLQPKSLLLLGGGAMTLPIAIRHEFPECHMDIVEIDPELLKIAKRYFGFHEDTFSRVHVIDATEFLKQDNQTYDVILIDVFTHTNIPASLQTELAAIQLAGHVNKTGAVAMNIIASYEGSRSAVLRRQVESLQTAFPFLELFPASNDQSGWLPQNFVLIGRKQAASLAEHLRYAPLAIPR